MNQGLYLTFFREGEPRGSELPPVGPFEHVVLREGGLVADRKSVEQIEEADHANASRWIEAELELQRAMGTEPGGSRRPYVRVTSKEGVYLRFASFGEAPETDPARELGPYAIVTVGPRGVEGDGKLLAVPTGSKRALWDLTSTAGVDLAGVVRPDIALRTEWTAYHPRVRSAPAAPTTSEAPASALRHPIIPPTPSTLGRTREPTVAPPRPQPDPLSRQEHTAPTRSTASEEGRVSQPVAAKAKAVAPSDDQYGDVAPSTLLTRVSANARSSPAAETAGRRSRQGLQWGDALWTLRLVIIAVLVVFVGAFGYVSIRNTVNTPSVETVGVGRMITGVRWDYTVNNISRTTTAGAATSRGIYLVVRVAVRNHGSSGASLLPRDFGLVDSTGTEYQAISDAAGPYQSPQNSESPYVWAKDYPVGQLVTATVIFDIPSSLRGLQLVIREAPMTRVKLD